MSELPKVGAVYAVIHDKYRTVRFKTTVEKVRDGYVYHRTASDRAAMQTPLKDWFRYVRDGIIRPDDQPGAAGEAGGET